MLPFPPKISVIGTGAWGSAIAHLFAKHINEVTLYSFRHDTKERVIDADIIALAIPTQAVRPVLEGLKDVIKAKHFLICCKGLETRTHKFISDVIEEIITNAEIAVISGPNFAHEIIENKVAAAVLASKNQPYAKILINSLSHNNFRLYYSEDIIGVQITGAVKNVIAIAAGIIEALNLGDNAKAALITRGLAETARLIKHCGGSDDTIMGLAGVGDFILTCGSLASRNMQFGYLLGQGNTINDAITQLKTVEGYHTALVIENMVKQYNLDMPICRAVYNVLYHNVDINTELDKLLNRPLKII